MGKACEQMAEALKADMEHAKTKGVGVKMVAEAFHHSDSWTYELIRGEQPFPLKLFPEWVKLTGGKHLAQWIAQCASCDLVPLSEIDDAETTVLATMREATEAVYSASKALEDNQVTQDELAVYRKNMNEAIEHLRRLERVLVHFYRRDRNGSRRAATLREA